jgi:tRNA pseudouridine38-40 synthase
VRIDVAYDGTAFHGWQTQPELRTVQGVLEACLAGVLGESVRIVGAGRTDAGCHARGQVASFVMHGRLPVAAVAAHLRRQLPDDVAVNRVREAPAGFDARRSARARRYTYRLLDRPDVLLQRTAWFPRRALAADALEQAMRPLAGERDCAAFAARGGSVSRTECRIHRAAWRRWEGGLQLDIVADHFLYHMVRNVVGTALVAMRQPDPAAAMEAVVDSRDRAKAGPTAPPQGLCLEEVFYPAEAWS